MRMPRIQLEAGYGMKEFYSPGYETFFGYYDVTPISTDEKLILASRIRCSEGGRPSARGHIDVGYFRINDDNTQYYKIGDSSSWCWQQGCRLQWYPQLASEDNKVLYNVMVNGSHGAVLADLASGRIIEHYERAIYSVSPDGSTGISLNFSRLQRCRPGYGYSDLPDTTVSDKVPANDGLWSIEMASGKTRQIFSLAQIAQLQSRPTMVGAEHYFNHILWNPDSSRFLFLHIWINDGKRRSRLITADHNGGSLCILYNEDHVSHHCWLGPKRILAYSTHKDTGTRFHIYQDGVGRVEKFGGDVLTLDGHPSQRPNKNQILLDTYPNANFEQELFIYDRSSVKKKPVGRFFNPIRFSGEFRCDLHPRWSPSGDLICIDSAASGVRKIYVIGNF